MKIVTAAIRANSRLADFHAMTQLFYNRILHFDAFTQTGMEEARKEQCMVPQWVANRMKVLLVGSYLFALHLDR